MEFRRALHILATRWWLIAVVGLAGIASSLFAAQVINSRIVPDFEAKATIEYLQLDGESSDEFGSRLAAARTNAIEVLQEPSQDVTVDRDSGRLTFSMTGPDPDVMVRKVSEIRAEFLSTDSEQQRFEEATTTELARLQEQIDAVRVQLQESTPPLPQIDLETAAEREQLAFEIASLRQTMASLRIQLAFPELATDEAGTLQAELDRSEELLVRLSQRLATLPSESTTDTTQTLDSLVLQRHLQDLEARYVTFSLGLLEQPDVIGPISPVFAVDSTRPAISRRLAAALGILAGVLIASISLLVTDRVKKTLWTVGDLEPIQNVGLIDRARPGPNGRPWYPRAGNTARRRQLQAFRAALDPVVAGRPVSVGLVGVSVPQSEVQALAADLAASVAASGTRVLLIDAAFEEPTELPEYGADLPDLAQLLSNRDPMSAAATIKRALAERNEVLSHLTAMRAGSAMSDQTDALAGPILRMMLATAAELEELVIMAVPPHKHPGTEVLSQRLDHVVLVCRAKRTTRREYLDAVRDFSERYASLSGVALLDGRLSRRQRPTGSILAGFRGAGRHRRQMAKEAREARVQVSVNEIGSATEMDGNRRDEESGFRIEVNDRDAGEPGTNDRPEVAPVRDISPATGAGTLDAVPVVDPTAGVPDPDERSVDPRGASEQAKSVGDAVARLKGTPRELGRHMRTVTGIDRDRNDLGDVVVDGADLEVIIDDRDPSGSDRDAAERYLVGMVLRMVGIDTERPGWATADGLMLVTLEDGERNAAETLERAIDLDSRARSVALRHGITAVLGGRASAWRLHQWIQDRFFEVHVEMAAGDPDVWLLSSSRGAFQALVRADTFAAESIQTIRSRSRTTISRLERALNDAGSSRDLARIGMIEAECDEVRSFNEELYELWRSGWLWESGLDRPTKFAELQRLGLIPTISTMHAHGAEPDTH